VPSADSARASTEITDRASRSPARSDESPKVVVSIPSCRAGAEPGEPIDSAEGPGERIADSHGISQLDDIPSIILIRSASIILITLTFVADYKFAGTKHHGSPFVSYIILAEMVKMGWRLGAEPMHDP
jgi:hypothetical protein